MLAELLAPARCVACGTEGDDLCAGCAERLIVLGTADHGDSGHAFDSARSLVAFAEPARALTLRLKRRGGLSTAAAIGSLLAAVARREGLLVDVVTHVPTSRGRSFDHAQLIAAAVARDLGSPARRLLRRSAKGPRQADVPLAQRRANVRDRFVARATSGRVLLVDDVFTTGSTADACALALRRAGACSVDVVTWARTLLRGRSTRE